MDWKTLDYNTNVESKLTQYGICYPPSYTFVEEDIDVDSMSNCLLPVDSS